MVVDATQGERARAEAQRMFRRVLAQWAMDMLVLRQAGGPPVGGSGPGAGTKPGRGPSRPAIDSTRRRAA